MTPLCRPEIGEQTCHGTACETDFLDVNDKVTLSTLRGKRAMHLRAVCKTKNALFTICSFLSRSLSLSLFCCSQGIDRVLSVASVSESCRGIVGYHRRLRSLLASSSLAWQKWFTAGPEEWWGLTLISQWAFFQWRDVQNWFRSESFSATI